MAGLGGPFLLIWDDVPHELQAHLLDYNIILASLSLQPEVNAATDDQTIKL